MRNCGSAVPFVCAFLRRGRSVTELSGESYTEVDAQCDKLVTAVDRGITEMKQPGTSCAISDQKPGRVAMLAHKNNALAPFSNTPAAIPPLFLYDTPLFLTFIRSFVQIGSGLGKS